MSPGAGNSEAPVDAVQDPVGPAETGPLLHALHLLHGYLHHRGARLHVPPRVQQRTLERPQLGGQRAGGAQDGRDVRVSRWRRSGAGAGARSEERGASGSEEEEHRGGGRGVCDVTDAKGPTFKEKEPDSVVVQHVYSK